MSERREPYRTAKYHARPCEVDGYRFDSQAEAARYQELRLLERAGRISDLQVHPRFEHAPGGKDAWTGKAFRAVTYEADFSYFDGDHRIVEDVKGFATAAFGIKRRLFLARHPHCELRVLKVP